VRSRCELGAIGSAHQRPDAIGRSLYATAMGCAEMDQSLVLDAKLGDAIVEISQCPHHCCLGLDGNDAYSTLGANEP
jgi:hypothetical protein